MSPVSVGEDTEYRMDIWDTAYTLAPGHRLRLWLSSSDTPTHEPLEVAGRNLIYHDSDHPSELLLSARDADLPCASDPAKCPALIGPASRSPRPLCRPHRRFVVPVPRG